MKVSPAIILLNLFLIGSISEAAIPIEPKNSKPTLAIIKPHTMSSPNDLKCDACEFIAKGLDDKVFHNEHLIELAQNELDNICNVLPASVHDLCLSAVNNTVPELLSKIGDFVASEGCQELGICKNETII